MYLHLFISPLFKTNLVFLVHWHAAAFAPAAAADTRTAAAAAETVAAAVDETATVVVAETASAAAVVVVEIGDAFDSARSSHGLRHAGQ